MINRRDTGDYDDRVMVLRHPAPDPIDQDIERLLADPEIRASLEESEARATRGETIRHSDNEARKIVGLPPLPDGDPRLEPRLGAAHT